MVDQVDQAVSMVLEPFYSRQLGDDGLFILWRDGREAGRREGLACILSMCPNPDCACQDVYVDGFVIDEQAGSVSWDDDGVHITGPLGSASTRSMLEENLNAIVDPNSGETIAHPDLPEGDDPNLLGWLASEMDGELLELLHRYRARAKGYPLERPRNNIDLDAV